MFKYVDCTGLPILADGEIRISNPSKLNDPFEVIPFINPPTREQIQEKLSDPDFAEHAVEFLLESGEIQPSSEAKAYLDTKKDDFIEHIYESSRNKALIP